MTKAQFLDVLDRIRDVATVLPDELDSFGVAFGRFANVDCRYPGVVLEVDGIDDTELVYRLPVREIPKPRAKAKN